MKTSNANLVPYIQTIRGLDFVQGVEFRDEESAKSQFRPDGQMMIATASGKYPFAIEQKSSYLDRAFLNSIINQSKKHRSTSKQPLLLFARYIPQQSAAKLIENGVNFVDRAGNMHLVMGSNYARTVTGKKEESVYSDSKPITATGIQLLFTYAINPDAARWTVRELAEAAGTGKSNVANVRHQFVDRGLLRESNGTFDVWNKKEFEQELLRGYGELLRPKLFINRFRAEGSSSQKIVSSIRDVLSKLDVRWSLTGGPASYELQHFYKGAEIPIFIEDFSDALVRDLRLMPDAQGPIILFRSFGTAPFWKVVARKYIAHPWLIYCELMRSTDPRAHESADEIREEFLQW